VVKHLRRLVEEGTDFDCFKMNAFRIAEETGVSPLESVRSFLYATRLGVTDLTWDIHCPSCQAVPDFHHQLMQLQRRAHCQFCELRWDLDFEDQVEVTFTINPAVRPVTIKGFREMTRQEAMEYFPRMGAREGRTSPLFAILTPGEIGRGEGSLEAGDYFYELPGHPETRGRLRVEGEPAGEAQLLRFAIDEQMRVAAARTQVRPGPVRLEVEHRMPRRWGFKFVKDGPATNWVSAAYVTSLQDFRDLFSGEFLSPDLSFAIKSATLMFTDIKGSTEMYERMGDAPAYALVQKHFELMGEVVRRHEGGIVKTIGDAVMAAFTRNERAVAAALDIQEAFARSPHPLAQIEVKIGIHRGPAIAVTSNRMLDYFGRTVNVAARAQGESRPGEVLLTEEVWSDPAVARLVAERGYEAVEREAELKGIRERRRLRAIRARRGV
jgi:class 3 adenylate cyclase